MKAVRRLPSFLRRSAWFARYRTAFSASHSGPTPRLLVDLSVIVRHDARTGIQRVVRALWSELRRLDDIGYEVVPVYAGSTHGYRFALPCDVSDGFELNGSVVKCGPGDIFLGLDLSANYLPHCVEQIEAWRAAGATVHNVVYDLLPLQRPEWFTPSLRLNFRRWFDAVQRHSDQLLCISTTVMDDVRAALGDSPKPALDHFSLSGNIDASAPSVGLPMDFAKLLETVKARPTILMVGTVEPRKGYDAVLAVFDLLWKNRPETAPNLLIIGKAGWQTEELQRSILDHSLLGERLHWRTSLSDEALTELYEQCAAVLVASRGEGFGLPLSEAAFHNKWVLVRDLPVFREQRLPNCVYFDDDAPLSLGSRVMQLLRLAEKGAPPPATLVDWSDCLGELLEKLGIHAGEDSLPQKSRMSSAPDALGD